MNREKLTELFHFQGQTFVVSGGTGVLGGEIVSVLAGLDANVVVLNRHLDPAQGFVKRAERGGGPVAAVYADVLDADSLRRAAELTVREFGRLDGLVNAVGGNRPEATTSPALPFFDLPADALRWVFDLNLMGTILPCQVFGRLMAQQGTGSILNIASMAGFRPLTRVAGYSAAKAAVTNFTQWLAVHVAQQYSPRIRVNAVAPGFFLTRQNRFLLTDEKTGELTERGRAILAHTPMGRFGQPEDLIGAVLWLLSPASAFVTGIVVPVDGGFSACSGV